MKSILKQDIDDFVKSVGGNNLSYREIDHLATAFFEGSEEIRQQIRNGNVLWSINHLKKTAQKSTNCTKMEQEVLRDFEIVLSTMKKVVVKVTGNKFETSTFHSQVTILTEGVINNTEKFLKSVRDFHDKCRQA